MSDQILSKYFCSRIEFDKCTTSSVPAQIPQNRKGTHLPLIMRNGAVGCTNMEGDLSELELRDAKKDRRAGLPR